MGFGDGKYEWEKIFADIFSQRVRTYYGEDPKNTKSIGFTYATRKIFGKRDQH